MSVADELIDSIEFRLSRIDDFGFDPEPREPWSYELDEPSLLLHTLRHDFDDIKNSENIAEANKLWEQTRSFVLTFHVGGLN